MQPDMIQDQIKKYILLGVMIIVFLLHSVPLSACFSEEKISLENYETISEKFSLNVDKRNNELFFEVEFPNQPVSGPSLVEGAYNVRKYGIISSCDEIKVEETKSEGKTIYHFTTSEESKLDICTIRISTTVMEDVEGPPDKPFTTWHTHHTYYEIDLKDFWAINP